MGLSIHYRGKIKSPDLVPVITEEIESICGEMKWQYSKLNDKVVDGIVFSPENCEPLFFTFNKNGLLVSPILLQYKIEPSTTISVKTQYAGMDVHKAVIKLIKYLEKKFFSSFNLLDEGKYWETNDENILKGQFHNYNAAINFLAEALEAMPKIKNETAEFLMNRIMRLLEKKEIKN